MQSNWLLQPKPNPAARARLLCIPFAGGGTAVYRPWASQLPADLELCVAQLPGREVRFKEPLARSCSEVVDALQAALAPFGDKPLALFGHSMGALIGFELARRLEQTPGFKVLALFASGRRAPHLGHRDRLHDLPDGEFLAAVRRLAGTPTEVLEHAELMKLMMPVLRADFEVVETYAYQAGSRLRCPVVALGGRGDSHATPSDLEAWREETAGPFRVAFCDGGHFFVQEQRGFVLGEIAAELSARLAVP